MITTPTKSKSSRGLSKVTTLMTSKSLRISKSTPSPWPIVGSQRKELNSEISQIFAGYSHVSVTPKTSKSCVWRSDTVSGLLLWILWAFKVDRQNREREEVESKGLILNEENHKRQNKTFVLIVLSLTQIANN